MPLTIRSRICHVNTHLNYFAMNNSSMKFREWLKQEMSLRDEMSQAKLARLSKVPQPTIQRILSGETPDPRGSTIDKIKGVLGDYEPETNKPLPTLTTDQLMIAALYASVPTEKKAEMLDQMARDPVRYKTLIDALLTEVSHSIVKRGGPVVWAGVDRRKGKKENENDQ